LGILNTFYLNVNNFSFLPGKYNDLLGSLPLQPSNLHSYGHLAPIWRFRLIPKFGMNLVSRLRAYKIAWPKAWIIS
jgi:hypothetical protein